MRRVLCRFLTIAATLACCRASIAEPPAGEAILKTLKPGHPRLMADAARFEEIKRLVHTDTEAQAIFAAVRAKADAAMDKPAVTYQIPDGKRLLKVSRAVVDRAYDLGLTYLISGDRRYADRLWMDLEAAANFKDWNPSHFLDTAEMTHAFAIAYDWLHDAWSEDQRRVLREAIVRHGLEPGLACYEGRATYGKWVEGKHNWNQVCNGGLVIGALAVGDRHPRLASAIIHGALRSMPIAMRQYAPDGGWAEGPAYWYYATRYSVYAMASMRTALGTDLGLSDFAGFSSAGWFGIHVVGPRGETFNFADSSSSMNDAPFMRWLGQRFNEPRFDAFAAARPRQTPLDLVWYRPAARDPLDPPPTETYFRNTELVTMRGAWDDPNATFVGFKAGSNAVNHAHLDLGSFVLDALGERWAVDLRHDSYNLPGYFGARRWEYYLNRSESHNTLLINPGAGPGQNPEAATRIEKFAALGGATLAVADLTAAYAPAAKSVKRGVVLMGGRDVIVQDEVAADEPIDLRWNMHTVAAVTLEQDGRMAVLTIGEKSIRAVLIHPEDARFSVDEAGPLPTSPRPEGQSEKPGVRRLSVRLDQVRNATLVVRYSTTAGPYVVVRQPLSEWAGDVP